MNSMSFVPARYQHSSPKQLNGFPRVSVRLRRALGFVSSRRTPVSSTAEPLVGLIGTPEVRIPLMTDRIKSSSVSAGEYESDISRAFSGLPDPRQAPLSPPWGWGVLV